MAASKVQIFILTFVCYVSIHALRTTYSFSKHFLDEALGVNKSEIGFVDSMLLLSLGIGHFSHALYPLHHPVKPLWIATMLCAIDYMLIPLLIQTLHIRSFWLLFVLMAINGYLQSFTWPNLLMIIQKYYDRKKNATLLGFWACNTNIGNIAGYFICYQFVLAYQYHWEIGMYMTGIFVAICAILIYLRVQQLHTPEQQKHSAQEDKILKKDKQILKEHTKLSHVFKQTSVVFITLAFSFIKSVIYGIMLWLPIYFHDIGLVQYQTWIPITYDIASVIGSLLLGYAFTKITSKGLLLAPLMACLVVLFLLLRYLELVVVGYFVLIAGVGACLGGSFNTMAGLVTMQLTKVVPVQYQNECLGFFSALTMSVANITTALTQILIGYVAQKEQSMIFIIFLIYSLLALLCFLVVIQAEYTQYKQKSKSLSQSKINKSLKKWFRDDTADQMQRSIKQNKQKFKQQ